MDNFYVNNKSYYERNAERYELASWYYFNKYKEKAVRKELKICIDSLTEGSNLKVLELGPGTGYLLGKLLEITNREVNYTGFDHSENMSSILKQRHEKKCSSFKIINQSVTAENLRKYIDKEESYDLILGSSILTHLLDYDQVVETLAGFLKETGVIYFVREPIHRNEVEEPCLISNIFERFYHLVYLIMMRQWVVKIFWPKKLKAENVTKIAPHMFKDGISMVPFQKLCKERYFMLFKRKYNRRPSSFMSFLENKWLSRFRKDIYGNTLFSIALQRLNSKKK